MDSFFSGTTALCSKVFKSLRGGLPAKLDEGGPLSGFAGWDPPTSPPNSEILLNIRTFVASTLHQGDDTYCIELSQGPIRKILGLCGKAGGSIDAIMPLMVVKGN